MSQRRVAIEVTASSVLKVLLAAVAVWAWLQLWQFFIALLVSLFLAVTFEPFAGWLEQHRIPRWLACLFPVLILMGLVVGFAITAGSSLSNQIGLVGTTLSSVEHRVRESVPALGPVLNRIHSQNNIAAISRYVALVLVSTSRALVLIALGLILTVYLLVEREKTLRWTILFVPKRHRSKMQETLPEIRSVISAYILGNLLTATFAMAFVFVTLTALRVQAALVLALLAGICDFIPLLGFVLSGVPAVLLAATVSKSATGLLFSAEPSLIEILFVGDQTRICSGCPRVFQ
jgi:predicted PurR-regulated permease PerM